MKVRPAALIVQNGSVLTMRYQYGTEFVYVLPGGNPDAGEALTEALARELKEELGIDVRVGNLVMAGEVLAFNKKEDTLHCLFWVDLDSDAIPEINQKETTAQAIEWIAFERLKEVRLYPNMAGQLSNSLSPDQFQYTGPLLQQFVS